MITHAGTPFERAIAADDRDFRELADFAPAMIWRAGTDRLCDWFNTSWLTFAGQDMAGEVGEGWATRLHPDDTEECLATYEEAFDRREPFSMEYRMRRHDGEYRWVLDHGVPYQRHGRFAGYWGSCTDISAHRKKAHAQQVLINELTHRQKNVLAVVQAMAMQSFCQGRSMDAAMEAFECRLHAMAAAHDLLVSQSWQPVSLRGVVAAAVAPHDPGNARITVTGPHLMVCPDTAMTVAMTMHELLTNAGKYGALSTPDGLVAICWTHDATPGTSRFHMAWRESGGPEVCPPARRGFGTRFIERTLGSAPGAEPVIHFRPDGVECTFSASVAECE